MLRTDQIHKQIDQLKNEKNELLVELDKSGKQVLKTESCISTLTKELKEMRELKAMLDFILS